MTSKFDANAKSILDSIKAVKAERDALREQRDILAEALREICHMRQLDVLGISIERANQEARIALRRAGLEIDPKDGDT